MRLVAHLVLGALLIAAAPPRVASANPVFGYTHMLPSPYTLSAGQLVYGTDVALGITDFFQVGTNVVRDFYKVFNANAKLSLLEFDSFAFSPYVSWETFNYRDIAATNPDIRVTSWLPGAVAAFELAQPLALFVGGNLYVTKTSAVTSGIETSGTIRGATGEADLSWAYGSGTRKRGASQSAPRGVGNVVSAGVSYDFTYDLLGIGISHHWPGFHLGVHYYPGADKFPLFPIIAGGGSVEL